MNFTFNEDQQLLADSVNRFMEKAYDFDTRRGIVSSGEGFSQEIWQGLAEMGLLALPLPGDCGGFDGGAVDMMATMEAFGEALVVEPYLATVLAARLVSTLGSEEQKQAILPAVAEGQIKLAFAQIEVDSGYELSRVATTAAQSGGSWVLNGEKKVVIGAPMADKLVVSATTGAGISLFLVDVDATGVSLNCYMTLDEMRAADVSFANASATLLGEDGAALGAIEAVVDFATALLAAEAVGVMKFANDATLEYLKTRKQFGMPIGGFQALQHRMVDMFIAAEQSRSMACLAASKIDSQTNADERKRALSAVKIKIADACRQISQESVQLHGGMGMTEELKISHAFRRLTMMAQQFGDADHHLERFAAIAG